jgi:hypothetical protein
VLDRQSTVLRPMIGRVPFRLIVGVSGALERVIEGKA